jgi:tetratricopeptide (TPR) repeat protein
LRGNKEKGVSSIAFSPNGKRIVSGSDKMIKVYDTISGAEVISIRGHETWVNFVAFTPDSKRIVSGSEAGMIKVWDAVSGTELTTFRNPDGKIWKAAFSPDGKTIVFNSGDWDDKRLRILNLSAQAEVKTLSEHKVWPSCMAFSRDGKYIVSADEDLTIKIWDVTTGKEVMTLQEEGRYRYIYCIAFSPDGKRIVSGGGGVTVWNLETRNQEMILQGHGGWSQAVVFSPDGKRIIAGCGDVKVWDASTGAELLSLGGDKISAWNVAISPDGKTIATTDKDKNIVLLESAVPVGGYERRRNVQAAQKVVEQFYEKSNSYHDTISSLRSDNDIDGPVRQLALQIANCRRWEDAEKLNKKSWEVVSLPDGNTESYQAALENAKKAKDLEPDDWAILNTLGTAWYRVGAYEKARVALTRAGKIRANYPLDPDHANVAFLAMTLYQLGLSDQAQASIDRLRSLFNSFKEKDSRTEKKLQPFLFETEKLFAGENTKLFTLWEHVEAEKLGEAAQLLKELRLSTDPKDSRITDRIRGAVMWLGRAYYKRAKGGKYGDDYAGALADYEKVVSIDPNHAEAFNDLALLRVNSPTAEFRNGAKAVEEATKACELTNWKNSSYFNTLAAAYSETGDFLSAAKWQEKAIGLLSENARHKWQANYEEKLKLYQSAKPYHQGSLWSFSTGRMVAWWEFEQSEGNTIPDSSGNGLDGNFVGDAHIVSDPERGNVLKLDGDGDYVDCGSDPAFNITGSITVAAWIKVNASSEPRHMILGSSAWCLFKKEEENTIKFLCNGVRTRGGGHNQSEVVGITKVNDGGWHHVAAVYDGTRMYLYMDGRFETPRAVWGSIDTNHGPVYIGGNDSPTLIHTWNGLIDDVRIYSYALSEAEIKALHAGQGPGPGEKREEAPK